MFGYRRSQVHGFYEGFLDGLLSFSYQEGTKSSYQRDQDKLSGLASDWNRVGNGLWQATQAYHDQFGKR
jgi:hypothetical protein